QRIGAGRVAGDPAAVAEILRRCAGLPLALVITAAWAAMNAHLPLAVLAEQLRGDRDRLDALTTGDPGTDLRAVFSWSYRALAPEAARLFRLLGLHPGPEITVPAAASLAALTLPAARNRLAELVRANLAAEPTPGRYTMHDLVRTFASEMAAEVDQGRSRRAAARRMFDHYLHSAHAGDRLSNPARDPLTLAPAANGVSPEYPSDTKEALAWFTAERPVLVALVEQAASTGMAQHAWQLAWSLWTFLDLRGHWDDLAATQRIAIAAARETGDRPAQADAHRMLARAYTRRWRNDEAHAELLRALELYRVIGSRAGQSQTHLNLSLLRERQGRIGEALEHARQSLDLFRKLGDGHGQARALNAAGWYHALLGDHTRALSHCQEALARLRGLDDRVGEATTLDSIGYARMHLGEHEQALADFQRAIDLYRDLGDRHLEAFVQVHIGDTYEAIGDAHGARAAWRDALSILDHFDPPEAAKVRAKLARAASFSRDPVEVQSTLAR
ncbi:tetratricopeptide repeat protein, partial [Allorhizocola rhizosphaerae]|uniref:tetratricopeptide repeat protein n=1 Tax=Allorhizocola rhizosphaerae TaxID=1872709 RepID=UPI0013C2D0AC